MYRKLPRLAVVGLSVTLFSGCGLAGPDEYGPDEKNVTAEQGEKFVLSAPVAVAMGEWWYLTKPAPDASVVRSAGKREDLEGEKETVGGSSGTDFFDFEAVGPGTTRSHLIQCPPRACSGGRSTGGFASPAPAPSGHPAPSKESRPTVHTYTVTVTG